MNLVLLPGMDGTGVLFGPLLESLGSQFKARVVRYSSAEPKGYAELTALARAELPSASPVVLLGESFSGPIAISLAASCSSRVKGLILCCSFARNPRPFFSRFRFLAGAMPVAGMPKALLSYLLLGRFSNRALRDDLSDAVAQVSASAFRARLKSVLSVNVTKELSELSIPILYLQASCDRVVPPCAAEVVSRLNPHTRVVHLEAPHLLLQVAPVEAARAIRTFVAEVESGV